MLKRSDIRRLAMQALYQFDMRGEGDRDAILDSLRNDSDDRESAEQAFQLAEGAWLLRGEADALSTELAPDWPTYRQPPIDRAILRLAFHEIKIGHAPAKVAINEAVDLAKTFCTENSPSFINGVLDKMAKRIKSEPGSETDGPEIAPPRSVAPDAWLADAMKTDD